MRLLSGFLLALTLAAAPAFRPQEIQANFGVVYAVLTADMNRDSRPDIVVINATQAAWFENPTWARHIILDGATKPDNVALAAHDIDGDGHLDLALAAGWQPSNTASGGSLQWLRRDPSRPGGPWLVSPIGEEPTLHRIRWADVDGDSRPELIAVPLHGRGNRSPAWEGRGSRVLVYWPPAEPAREPWRMEIADSSLHVVHNFITVGREIWLAAREGVFALERSAAGQWSRRRLGEGAPGEIKLGRVNGVRHLATVEPWHASSVVVYEEPTEMLNPQAGTKVERPVIPNQLWRRTTIDTSLAQAHALGWADFDLDGSDELAVGWRGKPWGLALYKRVPSPGVPTPTAAQPTDLPARRWAKTAIDGAVAVEDLAVEDLNGDSRPDIVAVGRATSNVVIYWNETAPAWPRHEVARGYANQTAIAADFTGDGLADVIANDSRAGKTWLYVAPRWTPVLLHTGAGAIHSEVIDVDEDGDPDFIGARYTPGLIFWLERPADPLRGPWPYHVVDDHAQGGVNGIHGLITGDVDRDGRLDLIGNSGQPDGAFPNSLAWFRIPPNPRAAPRWERNIFAHRDAPGLSHYLGFGDVDGDSRPDIAAAAKIPDQGNWFAWWRQPADPRAVWHKSVIATAQEGATNILIADLNGDGRADFLASRGHGRGLVWYENPAWTPHPINDEIVGAHSLALGDIDNDGDIDAVTCAKDSLTVAWFENDGRGRFTTHHIHELQAAYDIRLTDMDRDGDLDVLVAGQESQNVVWFENTLARPRR